MGGFAAVGTVRCEAFNHYLAIGAAHHGVHPPGPMSSGTLTHHDSSLAS
jgi:hypothetical protein